MELEWRATGQIIKIGLRHREPRLSLETASDTFLAHRHGEHDRLGGRGVEEERRLLGEHGAPPLR